METINRYIYAVIKHLPEEIRADVDKELRTNIEDMLPPDYTEQDVRRILNELGNPAKLADEYQGHKKYLIGPSLYNSYLSTLKLVMQIVIPIIFVTTIITVFLDKSPHPSQVNLFINLFTKAIAGVISAAVQVFLWVTLVYVVLERAEASEGKIPFSKNTWSVDDLAPLPPESSQKISRWEAAFEIGGTVLFAALFIMTPSLIGWFESFDGSLILRETLFNLAVLQIFVPGILAFSIIGVTVGILKLVYGSWNWFLAFINTVANGFFLVLSYLMLSREDLFNSGFKALLMEKMDNPASLDLFWTRGLWIAAALLLLSCTWDSIEGFLKAKKQSKKLKLKFKL